MLRSKGSYTSNHRQEQGMTAHSPAVSPVVSSIRGEETASQQSNLQLLQCTRTQEDTTLQCRKEQGSVNDSVR